MHHNVHKLDPDSDSSIDYFENFNLSSVQTPVDYYKLEQLLRKTNYDRRESEWLVDSFEHGFELGYEGDREVRKYSPNLKLRIGSERELWNKVMKEVKLKRYAGPFKEVPFDHFIQSPIGLLPKDQGKSTRLICHLSYPRNGSSVNSETPADKCSVNYPSFDDAVQLCVDEFKKLSNVF